MTAVSDGLIKKLNRYIPILYKGNPDEYPPTIIQNRLLNDPSQFICCHAGRRSRKTFIFLRKFILRTYSSIGRFALCAPTHQQVKTIFWRRAKEETYFFQARKPNETNLEIELKNGSVIFLTGLQSSERIEGSPVDGFLITEVDSCPEEMWLEHILPMELDTGAFFYLDGVPNGGLGWYYDICMEAAGGKFPERDDVIGGAYGKSVDGRMSYYRWKSSDVHPQEKIDNLIRQYKYNLDLAKQELEGEFIKLKGAAYRSFGDWNLKRCEYNPALPVHIGWDFNRTPHCCTFSHILGDSVHTFGEACIDDCTTPQMVRHILQERRFPADYCFAYPDATGRARKTNAAQSDLDIIRDCGIRVMANSSNPPVRDRIGVFNNMLKDYFGNVRQFIDPERCPKLILDMNKVILDSRGNELEDQKKQGLTHVSSAHGYMLHFKFPLQKVTAMAL